MFQVFFLLLHFSCHLAATYGSIDDIMLKAMWEKYESAYGTNGRAARRVGLLSAAVDRKQIFYENAKKVLHHQRLYQLGKVRYDVDVNAFTGMDDSELHNFLGVDRRQQYKTKAVRISSKAYQNETMSIPKLPTLPPVIDSGKNNGYSKVKDLKAVNTTSTLDLRDMGYVTHVKDQLSCGSCWAFSVVGALEGQLKKLRPLSEQMLLDCTTVNGCDGYWPEYAMEWLIDSTRVVPAKELYSPYSGKQEKCLNSSATDYAAVTKYLVLSEPTENDLTTYVARLGPASIIMTLDRSFLQYKTGIYDNKNCSGILGHAMLVVGYGSDNGRDYWLVKNSWGESWGEEGYGKILRGSNLCEINDNFLWATVEDKTNTELPEVAGCVDQSIYCISWGQLGYCNVNNDLYGFMRAKCVATCTKCLPPKLYVRSCKDTKQTCDIRSCKLWTSALYECRQYCGLCKQSGTYNTYPYQLAEEIRKL